MEMNRDEKLAILKRLNLVPWWVFPPDKHVESVYSVLKELKNPKLEELEKEIEEWKPALKPWS